MLETLPICSLISSLIYIYIWLELSFLVSSVLTAVLFIIRYKHYYVCIEVIFGSYIRNISFTSIRINTFNYLLLIWLRIIVISAFLLQRLKIWRTLFSRIHTIYFSSLWYWNDHYSYWWHSYQWLTLLVHAELFVFFCIVMFFFFGPRPWRQNSSQMIWAGDFKFGEHRGNESLRNWPIWYLINL